MIYTVTLNPSIDYMIHVDNFTPGALNRTTGEKVFAGGKGINVSIVLKNLGIESTALGFLAGFTGCEIERELKEKGIHTDFIHLPEGISRINMKIYSHEESEINGKGPAIQDENIQKLYEKVDLMGSNDILVLAGSVPDGIPNSLYRDIMHRIKQKQMRIIVDATGDLLMNTLPYHPFLIKPNNHELGELFDVEINDGKKARTYAEKLRENGARNVIVSMAGDGAVFVGEDGTAFTCDAPAGKVINTVGAGDSMVAGFLAGYLKSGDYREAFQLGVCAGSASAFSEQLATGEEVKKLKKSHTFLF